MSLKGHSAFAGPRGISSVNRNINAIEKAIAKREAEAMRHDREYEARLRAYADDLADFVRQMDATFDGIDTYRGVTLRTIHDALGRERQQDTIAALAVAGIYPDERCPASYSCLNSPPVGFSWIDSSTRTTVRRSRTTGGSL